MIVTMIRMPSARARSDEVVVREEARVRRRGSAASKAGFVRAVGSGRDLVPLDLDAQRVGAHVEADLLERLLALGGRRAHERACGPRTPTTSTSRPSAGAGRSRTDAPTASDEAESLHGAIR